MKSTHQIQVDITVCNGCGLCVKDCVDSNISLKDQKAAIRRHDCLMCGHCVAICPQNAVHITGFDDVVVPIGDNHTLDSDHLLHCIKSRRSVRHFKPRPVEADKLNQIIQAGRYTPTAKNTQGVRYIVITDNLPRIEAKALVFIRRLKKLADLVLKDFRHLTVDDHFLFKKAPAVIAVLSDNPVDAGLAASNMELMAQAQGLGVLYSGFFSVAANYSPKLRRALGLKGRQKVVTTLVLGYPAIQYQRTAPRRQAQVQHV